MQSDYPREKFHPKILHLMEEKGEDYQISVLKKVITGLLSSLTKEITQPFTETQIPENKKIHL
jgi:hypothetical protein